MPNLLLILPPKPGDLPHEWRSLRTTDDALEAVCSAALWPILWPLGRGPDDGPVDDVDDGQRNVAHPSGLRVTRISHGAGRVVLEGVDDVDEPGRSFGPVAPSPDGLLTDERDVVPDEQWEHHDWGDWF